jgi:hypothetical protein
MSAQSPSHPLRLTLREPAVQATAARWAALLGLVSRIRYGEWLALAAVLTAAATGLGWYSLALEQRNAAVQRALDQAWVFAPPK